jgi:hypothetical protein
MSTSATALHRCGARAHREGFFHVRAGLEPGDRARPGVRALRGSALVRDRASRTWKRPSASPRPFTSSYPGKLLAYNCSPSFNWKRKLDDATIAKFQRELGAMGYKFQFITLAGFHALNYSMFELAQGYKASQMTAYVQLQQAEFAAEARGYTATKHQREVGAGYFDDVTQTISCRQLLAVGTQRQHRGAAVRAARPAPTPGDGEIAQAFESALYAMRCAQLVVEGFLSYNASFREITRRAIERFADRDWAGSQRDAVERIELYERWMQAIVVELEGALGDNARQRELWIEVKRHFSNLTHGLPDNEFCKTFFSSVTRQLFGTVGVSADIEFVATDLDPLAAARPDNKVTSIYPMQGDLTQLIRRLLESQPLARALGRP